VRQRQPHGADLLPARQQAVNDPARDDEVRPRVVVAEREAGRCVVERGRRPDQERGGGEERGGSMTLQVS